MGLQLPAVRPRGDRSHRLRHPDPRPKRRRRALGRRSGRPLRTPTTFPQRQVPYLGFAFPTIRRGRTKEARCLPCGKATGPDPNPFCAWGERSIRTIC